MTELPVDKTKLITQLEALLNHPSPWSLRNRLAEYINKIKNAA